MMMERQNERGGGRECTRYLTRETNGDLVVCDEDFNDSCGPAYLCMHAFRARIQNSTFDLYEFVR